ncbi:MAG: hypothetical protein IKV81_00995 [Clostridia bacterium]|nr:hypothetical protein [Clostridia bacterium]
MVFNENILNRVKEREQKSGVYYAKKDGKGYKICKWLYILAFAFTMVINALYIIGILLIKSELPSNSTMNMNGFITVSILTAVMILMLILSKFNDNHIIAGVFGGGNAITSVCLIIVFGQMLGNTYVNLPAKFYLLHLLPLAIVVLCSLIMSVIVINAHLKTKKAYEQVLEIVFREYNALPDENKPDWEEFVNNYKF